ncbi:MAG: antirestriction protein ArdA [Aeromicrobium sp.]|uniref:antirestriction protein ArdA n=1 Tax=Aeromicrobium sp. TaxID=1871063 RepID=UPI0039E32216
MTAADPTTPRVWIACLACYSDGRLVGDWFDAEVAADVTLDEIHAEFGSVRMGCEEVWCFDAEYLLTNTEMSPAEAQRQAELLAQVDGHLRQAFRAFVALGDYAADGDGLPDVSEFEDRYCGEWPSFRDYSDELVDDTGMLREIPESVVRYFDYAGFARDLEMEHSTAPTSDFGVYVFRDQ